MTGKYRVLMNLAVAFGLAYIPTVIVALQESPPLDGKGWGVVALNGVLAFLGILRAWNTDTVKDAELTAAKKDAEHADAMAKVSSEVKG